jgi:hypothetical protein
MTKLISAFRDLCERALKGDSNNWEQYGCKSGINMLQNLWLLSHMKYKNPHFIKSGRWNVSRLELRYETRMGFHDRSCGLASEAMQSGNLPVL